MIQTENSKNFKKFNLKCKTCNTCPDISFNINEQEVYIDDDYNNSVKMTMENFRELATQIKLGAFDEML